MGKNETIFGPKRGRLVWSRMLSLGTAVGIRLLRATTDAAGPPSRALIGS
ncbi:MAG: hypothetical protein ACR2II_03085 [Chthoniobacterales bacterium]